VPLPATGQRRVGIATTTPVRQRRRPREQPGGVGVERSYRLDEVAEPARCDDVTNPLRHRREVERLAHHQDQVGRRSQVDQFPGVACRQHHRLLDEHVQTAGQCLCTHAMVRGLRHRHDAVRHPGLDQVADVGEHTRDAELVGGLLRPLPITVAHRPARSALCSPSRRLGHRLRHRRSAVGQRRPDLAVERPLQQERTVQLEAEPRCVAGIVQTSDQEVSPTR